MKSDSQEHSASSVAANSFSCNSLKWLRTHKAKQVLSCKNLTEEILNESHDVQTDLLEFCLGKFLETNDHWYGRAADELARCLGTPDADHFSVLQEFESCQDLLEFEELVRSTPDSFLEWIKDMLEKRLDNFVAKREIIINAIDPTDRFDGFNGPSND